MHRSTRTATTIAAWLTLALTAAACGGGNGADPTDAPTGSTGDLEGEVKVNGSSTVLPIARIIGEDFASTNNGVSVSVDGDGTGDGFALFCGDDEAVRTDISDASRPIKDEEAQQCADNGVEFIELKVAIDGLTVLTHPSSEVDCLGLKDMYALVGPESNDFVNWSDAEALATELGAAHTPYPAAQLDDRIIAPGDESGTYDSFVEFVIKSIAEDREQEVVTREYPGNANDTTIIDGIANTENSFGWVGYAYFQDAGDTVKAIAVDGTDDGTCVEPTEETIIDGSYPLSRDLYVYVNAASAERPEVEAFVDYWLSDAGPAAVDESGYVQLADEDWSAIQEAWASR